MYHLNLCNKEKKCHHGYTTRCKSFGNQIDRPVWKELRWGHFIIIQPMGGTKPFRILFLFTYVSSYKFYENWHQFCKNWSSGFWFITAFTFLSLDGIHIDEQHKNDYNSRSTSPILIKLVSIPMFSRMGFLNMQFKFT